MEGLGDRPFRKSLSLIGGFDESCIEFLRVPCNAHVPSLAKRYNPHDTFPIPQAAQIMGSDPELMAAMTREMVRRGAHRVELNCGCPSNTVTGRGAGSSLLKDPHHLYKVASAMVRSVPVPVTVKMRSGFRDTTLFEENLKAAEQSGIAFLTLHPRTKDDGYTPPARWDLIARAKELLKIPVVGNGDITCPATAKRMIDETNCDALMIGRGAVINPWIFWEIKASYTSEKYERRPEQLGTFLDRFVMELAQSTPLRTKINKLKQLSNYLLRSAPHLLAKREALLKGSYESPDHFVAALILAINGDRIEGSANQLQLGS
jgi:tRNA-dihydrouridine synthase C